MPNQTTDQQARDKVRWKAAVIVVIVALGFAGFSLHSFSDQSPASSTLHGDKAHPAKTQGWLDTRLYFGLGPADSANVGVSESTWRSFLDSEVTSRFPAGLTVVDVYGQWQGKNQSAPERIRSKMLVIDYPNSPDNAARIESIRAAWKQRTGDQSVLKVTVPADISF